MPISDRKALVAERTWSHGLDTRRILARRRGGGLRRGFDHDANWIQRRRHNDKWVWRHGSQAQPSMAQRADRQLGPIVEWLAWWLLRLADLISLCRRRWLAVAEWWAAKCAHALRRVREATATRQRGPCGVRVRVEIMGLVIVRTA
jgi:hypothetical protein